MIEEVEMQLIVFGPDRIYRTISSNLTENNSCSDEKDHLATAVFVHGCSLHCELHTIHR